MKMRLNRWLAVVTVLCLCLSLAVGGCSPAADDGGNATAQAPTQNNEQGASTQTDSGTSSSKYEDLEPITVSDYANAPVFTDYIPDGVNLSGTKPDGTKWKIAWCSPDDSDESMAFMLQMHEELQAEYGFELLTFDGQSDPQKQADHVNQAITQGCDAIIFNPVDQSATTIALAKAREAGIVVVNSQNRVSDTEAYDFYVGPNDTLAAQQAASMLMEDFPNGAKIVMIDGFMGSTCQINRTAGFRGVLQSHPEYEIMEEQTAQWSTTEAMNVMESYLAKYPEIDAVFAQFDLAAMAAIQAAQVAGRENEIKFYSVDGIQAALDAIGAGGSFMGTSMQDFKTNSRIQVAAALAALNGDGDKLEKELETPNICIIQENAGNFEAGWG